MNPRLQLQLSMAPDWGQIDAVHRAVALCVTAVFGRTSLEDALAMVCSELLENAIKFGPADRRVRRSIEAFAERSLGGLGLPRIAYEGCCVVGCDVSGPGEVTVSARISTPSVAALP